MGISEGVLRIARCLALGLSLAPAAGAGAAVCTFAPGDSAWGPLERVTGAGFAPGCSPDGGDLFVVPAGARVSVADDLVFDPAALSGGIEVLSGGELTVAAEARGLRIAVGAAGLLCREGSSCRFTNRYRGAGVEAGRLLDEPDPRWHHRVGEVVPCAGDCDATPELVAFRYGTGAEGRDLAAVQPDDVLCFFDPDQDDAWASPDSGQCYDVVRVNADAPPYDIVFDVHQGTSDPGGWPLARRELKLATLASAAQAGERRLRLLASGAIGANREHVARWLRPFDPSAGRFADLAFKIQDTRDGDPDEVLLGDLRGVPRGLPAGTPLSIDYGWRRGDPFFVSVPVVVTSATPSREDSRFLVDGAYVARGLVLDHLWGPTVGPNASVELHQDVWIRDATSSGTGVSLQLTGRRHELFLRTLVTGGIEGEDCAPHGSPPSTACDTMHGLQVSCAEGLVIDGYSSRHLGDDHFVLDASVCNEGPAQVIGRRWHCAFMGGRGRSASVIDPNTDALVDSSFADLLVDDCVSSDAAVFSYLAHPQPAPIEVTDVVLWGLRGGGGGGDDRAHHYRIRNLTALGVWPEAPNVPVMPNHVEGFAVRESGSLGLGGNSVVASGTLELRRGFVRHVELSQGAVQALRAADGSSIEDVAILDVTTRGACGGGCAFVAPSSPAPYASWSLRHALVGYASPVPQLQSGLSLPWPAQGPGMVLGGLWLAGLASHPGFPALRTATDLTGPGAPTIDGALCFGGNGTDLDAGIETADAVVVTGVEPDLTAAPGGALELPPASPDALCGPRTPLGVTRPGWALARSGLLPEAMGAGPRASGPCANGLDDDGDGRTDHPDDPGCRAPEDDSERSDAACDDGRDDDGDGLTDYPADPACLAPGLGLERAACQDGLDNDGEPGVDFDGGASANGGVAVDVPDPDCPLPWWGLERPVACGLGFEAAAPLALLLARRRRRLRPRARPPTPAAGV